MLQYRSNGKIFLQIQPEAKKQLKNGIKTFVISTCFKFRERKRGRRRGRTSRITILII